MQGTHIEDAVQLIRLEYLEMPGLRLTFEQAQRLWSFPDDLCCRALGALTETAFLARARDGAYVRAEASLADAVVPAGSN